MLGPLASEDVVPYGTDMFRGWGKSKLHLPRVTRSGFKGFTVLRRSQFQSQRLLNETQVSFLGKPLFEMCCFHKGIAQRASALAPSVKRAPWSTFSDPIFFHLFFYIAKMGYKVRKPSWQVF